MPEARVQLDVEDGALGKAAVGHDVGPRQIAPTDGQMQVAMAMGQALAIGVHINIVGAAEAVVDMQMPRHRRQRFDFVEEGAAATARLQIGVAEIDGGADVGMADGGEFAGKS